MILINLLPEELRLKEVKHINIPYRQIVLGIFAILIIFTLFNFIKYLKVRTEHNKLQKQWQQMAEKSTKADELEKELGATIIAEVDFYDTLVDPPLQTARILNMLSDTIPKGVWLTELRFGRKKKDLEMIVIGLSQSTNGSQLVEIQNFSNNLKVQMEKFMVPESQQATDLRNRLKVSVVTSSRKSPDSRNDLTQFTATIQNELPTIEKKK